MYDKLFPPEPPIPEKVEPPPEWRLRPTFTRPLRWWHPGDALRLLYWVFYRPQVLRDYVAWVAPEAAEAPGWQVWEILRRYPALQGLVLQALWVTAAVPMLLAAGLHALGITVMWEDVAWSVIFAAFFSVMAGWVGYGVIWRSGNIAKTISWSVAGGMAGGVAFGVFFLIGGALPLIFFLYTMGWFIWVLVWAV